MLKIKIFVNNSWEENTILLYDETKEAVVIDCGCFMEEERKMFSSFLSDNGLTLVGMLNTHLHIDHVFGNNFIKERYNLKPCAGKEDDYLIAHAVEYAKMLGITNITPPPATERSLKDGDVVRFGRSELSVIATPGHTPGGICFYSKEDKLLISGDVLFENSIGRSDLPGGDSAMLLESIKTKLFVLPDDVTVIPGHGSTTSIGMERMYNPFFV